MKLIICSLVSIYNIYYSHSLGKSEEASVASTIIDGYHPPTILQMYNMSHNVSLCPKDFL